MGEKKLGGAGLRGQVAGNTALSTVGKTGKGLTYRGYAIEELAEKASFEEVAYMLLYGSLPTQSEYDAYSAKLKSFRSLPEALKEVLERIPQTAHPMDVMRTGCSMLGNLEPEGDFSNQNDTADRILASMSSIITYWYRYSHDGVKVDTVTDHETIGGQFLSLLTGKEPSQEHARALDVSLILYAEHGFNASTFTARTCASTLSDMHSCVTGAIGTLRGPLHGGANEEVMHMMNKIKKPENALKWINNALKNKDVVMGFGHRVYKSGDSRVPTMREYFGKVAKIKKDKTFEKIYDIVEKVMIKKKNIHPNVDYPTGPTYHLMGFDTDFFTPIFVISRITGWSAHIMEQHAANKLIRPLAKYKGSKHRKVMELNYR